MRKSAQAGVKTGSLLKKIKFNKPIAVSLPKFSFKNTSINIYLVYTLVIFSFLLGMLTNKIIYLQTELKSAKTAAAQTAPAVVAPSAIPTPPPYVNVSVGHLPPLGNPNAKVKVVEFADLRCPYCERFYTDTLPQLKKDYIDTGKISFYYRQNQFLGPASVEAGNATECANEQSKFWEFHNYLYDNQPPETDTSMYTTDKMSEIAGSLGLDADQFRSCLEANKYDKNVQTDIQDGRKAQVDGTPTFFINGYRIVGAVPYDQIKQQIEVELKK